MPTRLAYALARNYTPEYEAVSREIAMLRSGDAPVIGVLPMLSAPWRRNRNDAVWTAHPLALRLLARWDPIELLHVFAPLPLPRRLRWLPAARRSILTAISVPQWPRAEELQTFTAIVGECERDLGRLRAAGIDASRSLLIEPGCDAITLDLPDAPFTVGFASWPFQRDEALARGIDLLAAAAQASPDIRFRVQLRPGSQVDDREFVQLANVECRREVARDARELWAPVHVALAVFRGDSKSKSVPNSILEALAMGRPVIVSHDVGIGEQIAVAGAGLCIEPTVAALTAALQRIRAELSEYRSRAMHFGRRFDSEGFRRSYAQLYDQLLASR